MQTEHFKIVDRKATFGGEGTARRAAWEAAKAARGSVPKYLAAGGPRRYLARWADKGLIELK